MVDGEWEHWGRLQTLSSNVQNIPPPALRATPAGGGQEASGVPLNNTSSCHSGLDPESRKHLITLDTGLRRGDGLGYFLRVHQL